MALELVILGSGTSFGVPMVGCDCAVCRSADPHDRRTRAAAWLRGPGVSVLIDAGPDLRQQCLAQGIAAADALLITHTHADHLNGLDDVRAFTHRTHRPLPVYASAADAAQVRRQFPYIFADNMAAFGWGVPRLELHEVDEAPFEVAGLSVQPVPLRHGRWGATGYRVGTMAYLTDCSAVPETSLRLLSGVELLVIDALRWRAHPTHLSIGESLAVAERVGARRVVLTHLSHEVSHAGDGPRLPRRASFAYDGMVLPLPQS